MSDDLIQQIEVYFDRLWPIMRSITGDGVRNTLDILSELVPLEKHEIKTGTKVFDWEIPKEWVYRSAVLKDMKGNILINADDNNLHLVNYSIPFNGVVSRDELKRHLYSLEEQPNAIPYVTSYYKERWGFCVSHEFLLSLTDEYYEVCIDTDLIDGSMTYGEYVIPGTSSNEILFSTYVCHPSMANNELSGPLVTAFLAKKLSEELPEDHRYTYRFLFLPETIGSIAYLSLKGSELKQNLISGYVITCVGDNGSITFKRSRQGSSLSDMVAEHVLKEENVDHTIRDFFPDRGSDERQYCSPGFNLPVSSIIRSVYGEYSEYHTSLDNKDYISFYKMKDTIDVCSNISKTHEMNKTFRSTNQFCEPNLGKRGLYPTLSIKNDQSEIRAMFWLINFSDGNHSLLDISNKSGYSLKLLHKLARKCNEQGLLEEVFENDK